MSPASIKAIEERDMFFHHIVSSRGIAHLQNLHYIHHPAPRGLPEDLSLRNGPIQHYFYGCYQVKGYDSDNACYCSSETGEGENKTFKVLFGFVNDALVLCGDSELVDDQIADCLGDMLSYVPPRKVNHRKIDWEDHVHTPLSQYQ
jgi:hypothetical protein